MLSAALHSTTPRAGVSRLSVANELSVRFARRSLCALRVFSPDYQKRRAFSLLSFIIAPTSCLFDPLAPLPGTYCKRGSLPLLSLLLPLLIKTRSPRDPGVAKRGADTLAKMFSDFLDTQGGYRTRRADSFLLLVDLEKIDIRSIMKH